LKKNDLDAVEIAQKQRHLYLLNQVKNGRHLSQRELEELKKLEDKSKAKKKKKAKAKSKAAASADAEIIKTQKKAAKYAGVSMRTIRRWVKNGMPRTSDGHYFKKMLDFYADNEGNQPSEAKKKIQTADADYKDSKAKLMQIELEERQGELVPLDEIEAGRIQRIMTVKRAFMGMGRTLAPQLAKIKDERRIQKIINDQVRAIIDNFAGK
jgi:hypothetical protein